MNEKNLAVVTGASSGIGEYYAEQLAARGYNLLIVARRRDRLEKIAKKFHETYHVAVEVMTVDLSDPGATRDFAKYLSELDRVDFLVNSAGFATYGVFAEIDPIRIEQEVNVLLVAIIMLTRAVLPGMIERSKGDIVNVSSIGGINPSPYFVQYSGAKSGVITFTQALSHELKGSGVRVQALCSGAVDTEFNQVANVGESNLVPKIMVQPVEDLVAGSLRDLERGKTVCVPHKLSRVISGTLRHLPLSWRLAALGSTTGKNLRK